MGDSWTWLSPIFLLIGRKTDNCGANGILLRLSDRDTKS